jgi:hypothetical protein
VMFRASDRIRVDLGGDYRLVFTGPADPPFVFLNHKTSEFRLHAGLVFALGGRSGGGGRAGSSAPPSGARPAGPTTESQPSKAPRIEIGLGYSYLWDDRISQLKVSDTATAEVLPLDLSGSFPLGGVLSANVNLNEHIGVVAELSEHHRSQSLLGSPVDLGLNVLGLHAGLRYTDRDDATATPYIQALLGMTRFKFDALGDSASETDFSIQPGVGVMFRASDRIRVDLGGDYRLVFTGPADPPFVFLNHKTSEFRLHTGLVFQFGGK